MTIIMATHDIEFAARFSDRCALLFDGDIKTLEEPREFFLVKIIFILLLLIEL